MSNLKIVHCLEEENRPEIGDLEYGTFITGVPSGKDCIYVKVKKPKRKCIQQSDRCLQLTWIPGNSVIMNLTYGTLRQIPACTPVTPLSPVLTVRELKPKEYDTVRRDRC